VTFCDPYVDSIHHAGHKLKATPFRASTLRAADCVVIATAHKGFDFGLVTSTRRPSWTRGTPSKAADARRVPPLRDERLSRHRRRGFIGSHIAVRLLGEGHGVRVLDNLSTGRRDNLDVIRAADPGGRFEWMEGTSAPPRPAGTRAGAWSSCSTKPRSPPSSARWRTGRHHRGQCHRSRQHPLGGPAARSPPRGLRQLLLRVRGHATLPKHEGMLPAPLSPYAVSKLAGSSSPGSSRRRSASRRSRSVTSTCSVHARPAIQYAAVIPLFAPRSGSAVSAHLRGRGAEPGLHLHRQRGGRQPRRVREGNRGRAGDQHRVRRAIHAPGPARGMGASSGCR